MSLEQGMAVSRHMVSLADQYGRSIRDGQRIEAGRRELDDDAQVNQAYEHIARSLGQGGDLSAMDGDPVMATRAGTIAMGRFMAQRANTEQGRLQMLQKSEQANTFIYENKIRPLAQQAMSAYQKGDMNSFGAFAGELSKIAPFPYSYSMGTDGFFSESFRSSKDGKYVPTGERLTPQQIFDGIQGIMSGEQRVLAGADMKTRVINPNYQTAAARYAIATSQSNAEAMADPRNWITMQNKDGKTVHLVPQNRIDDFSSQPMYRVIEDGKPAYMSSMDEIMNQGFSRADVAARDRMLNAAGRPKADNLSASDQIKLQTARRDQAFTALRHEAAASGYIYDKDQGWFYEKDSESGEPDYNKPISKGVYRVLLQRATGGQQGNPQPRQGVAEANVQGQGGDDFAAQLRASHEKHVQDQLRGQMAEQGKKFKSEAESATRYKNARLDPEVDYMMP